MVFENLKDDSEAITCLRLLCKPFSTVGLKYLVPEIGLAFKSSSFARLRQISEHPVVSQHVQGLFYEADTLYRCNDMVQWEDHVKQLWFALKRESPGPLASERRADKKSRVAPKYDKTNKQIKEMYEVYKSYLKDQEELRHRDYKAEAIKKAMARMPNLKYIDMSMEYAVSEKRVDRHIKETYPGAHVRILGDNEQKESCGVPQLRSLLLGAGGKLNLERLRCGNVHWHFFQEAPPVFERMSLALQNLTLLQMHVTTRISRYEEIVNDDQAYHVHVQIPECSDFLRSSGRMHEFFKAAPRLKELHVRFDCQDPHPPATLGDIAGKFTWECLTRLEICILRTTGEEMMSFLRRHKSTLRVLYLDSVSLTTGTWPTLLDDMKKELVLDEVELAGILTSEGPYESYNLGLPCYINGYSSNKSCEVEAYLTLEACTINPLTARPDDMETEDEDEYESDEFLDAGGYY